MPNYGGTYCSVAMEVKYDLTFYHVPTTDNKNYD